MRLVITGGPRTGKTTMANELGGVVRHTDNLMDGRKWSDVSEYIASDWLREPGPWIIEGVAAVRGLRKFFRYYPDLKPCDKVVYRPHAWVVLTPGQERMTKGVATVWREIKPELIRLGVEIDDR